MTLTKKKYEDFDKRGRRSSSFTFLNNLLIKKIKNFYLLGF